MEPNATAPAVTETPAAAPVTETPTTTTVTETPSVTETPAVSIPASETTPATETPAVETTATTTVTPPERPVQGEKDALTFLNEMDEWEAKTEEFYKNNPDIKRPDTEESQEEKPAEETEKPKEEVKPAAETEVTPTAIASLVEKNEALKTALNADPAAKNAIFKMAREHAELAPYKELYPTVESAKFAQQTASRTVDIKSKFEQAETPEQMASAWENFAEEFRVYNADGTPKADAAGNPVYGQDFDGMMQHVIGTYFDTEIASIKARQATNKYGSDAERERDNDRLLMLDFLKSNEGDDEIADYSTLSPEIREKMERLDRENKELKAAKEGDQSKAAKDQRQQARQQYTQEYNTQSATHVLNIIEQEINALKNGGAVIPDYALNMKAPGEDLPLFFKNINDEFLKAMRTDPYQRQQLVNLELKPPTAENLKERVAFTSRLAKEYLPRIIRAEVAKMASSEKEKQAARTTTPATTAVAEPRGGAAPQVGTMTLEKAMEMAKLEIANDPKLEMLDASERNARIMTRADRIMAGR